AKYGTQRPEVKDRTLRQKIRAEHDASPGDINRTATSRARIAAVMYIVAAIMYIRVTLFALCTTAAIFETRLRPRTLFALCTTAAIFETRLHPRRGFRQAHD